MYTWLIGSAEIIIVYDLSEVTFRVHFGDRLFVQGADSSLVCSRTKDYLHLRIIG
jgi:hypothetical protein